MATDSKSRDTAAILRARPLHEAVVDRLRDMILDNEFEIGERLHDAKLAEALGVSRTPVREAVKLLATEGLVDLLPGRGARVAAYSLGTQIAVVEVMAGLERHACELAALRMTDRDFARLMQMHDQMSTCHRAGQRREYAHLNHEIHVGVVALAGNAMLATIHAGLMTRARRGRHDALDSQVRWTEAMAEHEQLMAALADRDGGRAGDIMFRHDLKTRDALQALQDVTAKGGDLAAASAHPA